jgi:hypothetical protein
MGPVARPPPATGGVHLISITPLSGQVRPRPRTNGGPARPISKVRPAAKACQEETFLD